MGDSRELRLCVKQVKKVYGEGTPKETEVVRDLSFDLFDGDFACVVGPSGSGKTTLLKCIAGLLDPTSGTVHLDGKAVKGPSKGLAVVFQEYGRSLFPWLTVEDNVLLPLKTSGVSKSTRTERMTEALEAVGLMEHRHKYPWQLSGGMQQRVAIARAVAVHPSVLLMDEPFAAVDAQTRGELEDLVRSVWKKLNMTILFVTHDIDESVYLGNRVLVLSSSPTVIQREIEIDLPEQRDQSHTRSLPRFGELRHEVYDEVQLAKRNPGGLKMTEAAATASIPKVARPATGSD